MNDNAPPKPDKVAELITELSNVLNIAIQDDMPYQKMLGIGIHPSEKSFICNIISH